MIDKQDIIEVNSDSQASDYVCEDREIELENEIIDRMNETMQQNYKGLKSLETFDRQKMFQHKPDRHKVIA